MPKHFTFQDRVRLHAFLEMNPNCSAQNVANYLGKSRAAVYYELRANTKNFTPINVKFNNGDKYDCPHLKKFPFNCDSCARTKCSHRCSTYDVYYANTKARKALVESRVNTAHKKATIEVLDKTVSQLIIDGLSIPVAMQAVNRIDVSETTIRRYINKGVLIARRHHLPMSVRFKPKKEYNYSSSKRNINPRLLFERTYQDYLLYMQANPQAKVVQLDSVIGKSDDKSAILTIYFLNSKFQLAIKYYRKDSNVNKILLDLYDSAMKLGFKLFDVTLCDNGAEFKKLPELEKDETEVFRCRVFYCDPYRSCQKAECERNHGFIRRIFRKGKSFNTVEQEQLDQALSNINSYPRGSLGGKTPYELFALEYSSIIASMFNIDKIEAKDLKLTSK